MNYDNDVSFVLCCYVVKILMPLLVVLQYEDGEEVVLWMNTVGPYHNRQETYEYFSLPFCRGPKTSIGHYHETLGEALLGVELEFSGLDIDFKGTHILSHVTVTLIILWKLYFTTNMNNSLIYQYHMFCSGVTLTQSLQDFVHCIFQVLYILTTWLHYRGAPKPPDLCIFIH